MLRQNSPAIRTLLLAVGTLSVTGIAYALWGPELFSPGPLSNQSRDNVSLGGASSHAEIATRCAACHVGPASEETAATRCMACHTDIGSDIAGKQRMHGLL